LVEHCIKLTDISREFMEKNPDKGLPKDYRKFPGKLDHTTCVSIKVGLNGAQLTKMSKGTPVTPSTYQNILDLPFEVAEWHTQLDPFGKELIQIKSQNQDTEVVALRPQQQKVKAPDFSKKETIKSKGDTLRGLLKKEQEKQSSKNNVSVQKKRKRN